MTRNNHWMSIVWAMLFYSVGASVLQAKEIPQERPTAGEPAFPAGSIQGEVRSLAGKPLKGIRVSAERKGNKTGQNFFGPAESNSDGRFRLEGLPEGRYVVSALGEYGASEKQAQLDANNKTAEVVLNPPTTAQERLSQDEDFKKLSAFVSQMRETIQNPETLKNLTPPPKKELPPGARVEGTVLDSAAKPIPGVIVVLSDLEGNPLIDFVSEADPQGRFLLENVPDGNYFLQAGTGPDRKTDKQTLRVKKSKPDQSIRLTLP